MRDGDHEKHAAAAPETALPASAQAVSTYAMQLLFVMLLLLLLHLCICLLVDHKPHPAESLSDTVNEDEISKASKQ